MVVSNKATTMIGAITLGELAEVGAVVVAVCAATMVPVLGLVRRDHRFLKEQAGRLESAERVGALVSEAIGRGLVGIDNTLDWSAGLIHRILLHREKEIDAARAIAEMRTMRVTLERAWLEVRLLTGGELEQRSALQQLTYRLGNHSTAQILNAAANAGGVAALNERALRTAYNELIARLEARQLR